MIQWLQKLFMPGSGREEYEEEVRHEQQTNLKRYAEMQVNEIEERLAYLQAQAAATRGDGNTDILSGT